MRNIISVEKIMCDKNFIMWFLMNNFPEGIDEENDLSMNEIISDSCSLDRKWVDEFTNYYNGVFEENDGYVDTPNAIKIQLTNNNELIIEFHPGDTIYLLNNLEIASTGPNYRIRVINFSKFIELTKNLDIKSKMFLLPITSVGKKEKNEFGENVRKIIEELDIDNIEEDILVKIIVNNCLL